MCSQSVAENRLAEGRRDLAHLQGMTGKACGQIRGLAKFAHRGGLGRNPDVALLVHELVCLEGLLSRLAAVMGVIERNTLPGLERVAEAARAGMD